MMSYITWGLKSLQPNLQRTDEVNYVGVKSLQPNLQRTDEVNYVGVKSLQPNLQRNDRYHRRGVVNETTRYLIDRSWMGRR